MHVRGTVSARSRFVAGVGACVALAWLFAPSASGVAWAANGPAHLVKNINVGPDRFASSNPNSFVEVGERVFFRANAPWWTGFGELWVTDRTPLGTRRVAANTGDVTVVGNLVYYEASSDEGTRELWVSDGTPEGTRRIAGELYHIEAVVGDRVFFLAGAFLQDLWVADPAGARKVAELASFANAIGDRVFVFEAGALHVVDESGNHLLAYNVQGPRVATDDTLFFANADLAGENIWRTDGTVAGTEVIATGLPSEMFLAANGLFYVLGDYDPQLWFGQGTPASSVRILREGLSFTHDVFPPTVVGGALLFAARRFDDNAIELWRSDGTAAGTQKLSALSAADGALRNGYVAPPPIQAGGLLYFLAGDAETGIELWRSDGTAAGTVRVKDINPGPASAFYFDTYWGQFHASFTAVGSTLYFVASDGHTGEELWKTDGSEAGTSLVKDLVPGADGIFREVYRNPGRGYPCPNDGSACLYPSGITARASASQLVFAAPNPAYNAQALYVTDGTPQGTAEIEDRVGTFVVAGRHVYFTQFDAGWQQLDLWHRDLDRTQTDYVRRFDGGVAGIEGGAEGDAFFAASDGHVGVEPWWTAGSGAVLLADIAAGEGGSWPRSLTDLNGMLMFRADDGVHGEELWRSDGTEAGTQLVKDINPGVQSTSFEGFRSVGGRLFFFSDSECSSELWRSDGSEDGTAPIASISRGCGGSSPITLAAVDETLYFFADDDVAHQQSLWRTDGTAAGTRLVRAVPASSYGETQPQSIALDGILLFSAWDPDHGVELWRSDGTEAGTSLVKDINPGSAYSQPRDFARAGDVVVFAAREGSAIALWRSDGTPSGTYRLSYLNPTEIVSLGTSAYLAADGMWLWRTDGTVEGTQFVASAGLYDLTVAGSSLFALVSGLPELWRLGFGALFTGDSRHVFNGVVGVADRIIALDGNLELWASDGSSRGTRLLQEIPGSIHTSYPPIDTAFTAAGDTIFFSADVAGSGPELWALPAASLPEICTDDCPSPTPTPTRTPLTSCTDGPCVSIEMSSATGAPGEEVIVEAKLRTHDLVISAVAHIADFDAGTFPKIVGGDADCWANPDLHTTISAFRFTPPHCVPGLSCTGIHPVVLTATVIPDGATLYSCRVTIAADARLGEHPIRISRAEVSDPQGNDEIEVAAIDGSITVVAPDVCADCTPTATALPEPSFTPTPTSSLACADGARCARIQMGSATGAPGDVVLIDVTLQQRNFEILGTTSSAVFDEGTPVDVFGGFPDCSINPEIRSTLQYFRFFPENCTPLRNCAEVRAEQLGDNPIADGSVLYTCRVRIAANAAPGLHPVHMTLASVADPNSFGAEIPVDTGDGAITVVEPAGGVSASGSASRGGGCSVSPRASPSMGVLLLLPILLTLRLRPRRSAGAPSRPPCRPREGARPSGWRRSRRAP